MDMVNVDVDLTWHTLVVAALLGLTSSLSVILVNPGRGLGVFLGAGVVAAGALIAAQTVWAALLTVLPDRLQPGVLSREVWSAGAGLGLAYTLLLMVDAAAAPGYTWAGEPTIGAAYAGLLLYGTVGVALAAGGRVLARKVRGSGPTTPTDS